MRRPDIALGCPPIDPDPILLEQLTMLAAASVAPSSSPWWQRVATKSGAVAVAGVMALSGAAYAARGELTPIVKSIAGNADHHPVRHHVVRDLSTPGPAVSSTTAVVPSASATPVHHGRRAHGFHAKRGKGAGWARQNDQGRGSRGDNGNGHAYGREVQGNRADSTSNSGGNNDNSQGTGQGIGRRKAPGQIKTGRHSASHGNHDGWSQSPGNSQSPN